MADLISMKEAKVALGLLEDTEKDIRLHQSIPFATAAVEQYTGRKFDLAPSPAAPAARTYLHDGSGIVIIDDAQHASISVVSIAGAAVATGGWSENPLPTEYPVVWWLDIPHQVYGRSPEMGFTRNEDVLAAEGRFIDEPQRVTVTANWGWPSVPGDVKMAAIWTVAAMIERPGPYVSESIAGYSRTQLNPMDDAIPPRAAAMLDKHVKR